MFYHYVSDAALLTRPDHVKNYSRMGALISIGSEPGEAQPGITIIELSPNRDDRWDEETHSLFDSRQRRFITIEELLGRFTEDEQDEYSQRVPPRIERLLTLKAQVGGRLDLDGDVITQLMARLVTANVLTAARVTEIVTSDV